MSGARKRSVIWNHFEPDEKKAKCFYCSVSLSTPNGNTGNLSRHMKSKHPTVPLVLERQNAPVNPGVPSGSSGGPFAAPGPSSAAPGQSTATGPSGPLDPVITVRSLVRSQPSMQEYAIKPLAPRRAELIDRQLIVMIAKEYHPLSLVEDEEFRKFLQLLNPSYSLPTRKTLSESILSKQYEKLLAVAKRNIEAAHAVCLSTDGWTSINNSSFIAVTAHYVSYDDTDIKLESVLLGCIEYSERHTAENLCGFLKAVIDDWQLTDKVTAIASDNAANIVAAVRNGNWRHIACFAHSINRAVQAALVYLNPTLHKVKEIVEYFKQSTVALNKLKEISKQLNVPELKLKQDVPTRWNSTYDMVSRIVAAKDAVLATLALLRSELSLTSEDWGVIEAAIPILEIFYDDTTEISGEKNVTLSKVAPLYKIMSNFIKGSLRTEPPTSRLPQIQSLLETLDQQLDRRFSHLEAHEMYAEATILDPRFKNRGFKHQHNFETSLQGLKLKVGRISQQRPPNVQPSTSHGREIPPQPPAKRCVWDEFDKEVSALHPQNPTAAGIVELDRYMQEPLLPRTDNPLIWWQQRKNVYPHLFRYMLKRFNLLATSVPCERVFSKAGYTLSERRSRLASRKLAQLLFIGANSHFL